MPDAPTDETEAVLTALADPFIWEYYVYPSGNGKWEWQGQYQDRTYCLAPPTTPDETDTESYNRLWRITVRPDILVSHAPTLEAAKVLCVHYALTGDWRNLEAIRTATAAEGEWYRDSEMRAIVALLGCKLNSLLWSPSENSDRKPLQFAAKGERGSYDVRWIEDRRWVMTFIPHQRQHGMRTFEHCFITRETATKSCSVHDNTGQWIGELKATVTMNKLDI